jgi:hypothetical protein
MELCHAPKTVRSSAFRRQFQRMAAALLAFFVGRILSKPRCGASAALAIVCLLAASARGEAIDDAAQTLPQSYRPQVVRQLRAAKENAPALIEAIRAARPEHREALAVLLANMPRRDLVTLGKDFLLENVELAYKARDAMPWGCAIRDELFFDYVLPYANVTERRDAWRQDFFQRFAATAKACRTPGEAAVRLNKEVFQTLKVKYHPSKRRTPDQSPYESAEIRFASCTGLSILLVDACRAVCIPARVVGTPLWANRSGNHTWAEVWDGQWRYTGAAEPGPLDHAWFTAQAAGADAANPLHRIYAVSWRPTGTPFPMVWAPRAQDVPAVDVTPFYTTRRTVTLRVLDRPGGQLTRARVTFRLAGQLAADVDVDGAAELVLAGGQTYDVEAMPPGAPIVRRKLRISTDAKPTAIFTLTEK